MCEHKVHVRRAYQGHAIFSPHIFHRLSHSLPLDASLDSTITEYYTKFQFSNEKEEKKKKNVFNFN